MLEIKYDALNPILKWPGGKRQLLQSFAPLFPVSFDSYCEPFVGGGAVLFHLRPAKALVCDANPELVNLYEQVRDNADAVIAELKKHRNDQDYYLEVRGMDRDADVYGSMTDAQRAARVLYLNHTCFNGLWRVNSRGEFNVPFGHYKNPDFVNEAGVRAVSAYLNQADVTFACQDFEESLSGLKRGSFAYLDPPYDPVSQTSNFVGYSAGGFGRREQERLKECCDRLDAKGVLFMLSNSATDFIKDLYKGYEVSVVKARRSVNARGDGRGAVDEVVIRNYQ